MSNLVTEEFMKKKTIDLENNLQIKVSLPVGQFYLVASNKGLCEISRKRNNKVDLIGDSALENSNSPAATHLVTASKQLKEYFNGQRKKFELALDPQGTSFQKSVWKSLLKIPYGNTISYQELAQKINNPKACRAVGNANGKNPLCIVIPCHRVIAADKSLGGYSGGIKMKKTLLNLEGCSP